MHCVANLASRTSSCVLRRTTRRWRIAHLVWLMTRGGVPLNTNSSFQCHVLHFTVHTIFVYLFMTTRSLGTEEQQCVTSVWPLERLRTGVGEFGRSDDLWGQYTLPCVKFDIINPWVFLFGFSVCVCVCVVCVYLNVFFFFQYMWYIWWTKLLILNSRNTLNDK